MIAGIGAKRPASSGARRAQWWGATALLGFALLGGFWQPAAADEEPPAPPQIRRIRFLDTTEIDPGELRKVMRLRQEAWWRPFEKNYFYGTDHLEPDLQRLVSFYRAEGYFFMRIAEAIVRYISREWVEIEIRIEEGPRIHVRGATVLASNPALRQRLAAETALARGEPLRENLLRRNEARLQEVCGEAGYALAEVTHELRFRGDSAEVRFHVTSGPLVRVGEIRVNGLVRTHEAVVRREIGFRHGDAFRQSRAQRARDRLFDLGLFRTVRILPALCDTCVTPAEPGAVLVDLNIALAEKEPGWYGGGGGFSSADEVRLLGEWGYRNVRGKGRALQVSVVATWSLQQWEHRRIDDPTEREVEAIFSEPWLFGGPTRGQLRAAYRFNREATFEEDIVSAEFSARRSLSRFRSLFASIQKKWVWSTDPTTAGRDYEIPSLSVSLREDRRDFLLDPQRGFLAQVRIDYAGGFLGGPISFTRWALGGSAYVPLGSGLRFAYRVRGGYLHPWGKAVAGVAPEARLLQIPYEERFRAGGATSVRGYVSESLGRQSDEGQPLGGLVLLLLNAELRAPLGGPFEAAIFIDGGNVWAHYREIQWEQWTDGLTRDQFRATDVAYAAGAGLRFRTPVGPLRLDLGWKLNRARRPGTSGGELHFSLGQAF